MGFGLSAKGIRFHLANMNGVPLVVLPTSSWCSSRIFQGCLFLQLYLIGFPRVWCFLFGIFVLVVEVCGDIVFWCLRLNYGLIAVIGC